MLKNSKERSGFALVWFLFSIAYTVVLLGTGYNFLAPFAAAIAAVTALIVFIRALLNKKFEPLFVVSYAYMILELFVYFLFWGADEFGKISCGTILFCPRCRFSRDLCFTRLTRNFPTAL